MHVDMDKNTVHTSMTQLDSLYSSLGLCLEKVELDELCHCLSNSAFGAHPACLAFG
jgi:hypothetical protein